MPPILLYVFHMLRNARIKVYDRSSSEEEALDQVLEHEDDHGTPAPCATQVTYVMGEEVVDIEVHFDVCVHWAKLTETLAALGQEATRKECSIDKIDYGVAGGDGTAIWLTATSRTPVHALLAARFGLLVTLSTPPPAPLPAPASTVPAPLQSLAHQRGGDASGGVQDGVKPTPTPVCSQRPELVPSLDSCSSDSPALLWLRSIEAIETSKT